jgi:acyl carrier protein
VDRVQILDHVRISLAEVLNTELTDLSEDARLFEELGVDSTSAVELLMAIEDTTGVEVDPDELDPAAFQTVGGVVDFIAAGLAKATVG